MNYLLFIKNILEQWVAMNHKVYTILKYYTKEQQCIYRFTTLMPGDNNIHTLYLLQLNVHNNCSRRWKQSEIFELWDNSNT